MARPQTFDKAVVLEQAMQIFWNQGYANTSIKDITVITKLQPGSLYGAFKNKRKLFLDALDLYFETLYGTVSHILQSKKEPLTRISDLFEYILSQKISNTEIKSCLLINTLLEIPPEDIEINKRISDMFLKIENELYQVLKLAKINGSLIESGDPKELASMLISGIFGIQIYNKIKSDKNTLNKIVDNLLKNLTNKDK